MGPAAALAAPARGAPRAGVDRAVVRFVAPEIGGVMSPQFIFERELAFEARLEALSDIGFRVTEATPFRERHVRAAMERHVAESLLAGLRMDRAPSEAELRLRARDARAAWAQRAGGERAIVSAAEAEGLSQAELLRVFRRQARASLYVDRMITPMLRPSRAELESLHASAETPFRRLSFREAEPHLRRWYVSRRLAAALQEFYQNARARVQIHLL
ncbi:MAG: hypothetical protein KIT72_00560 [Polyangiaceae bacterium]|nr:hypothetical protein [Polyangiaceae bacterium]MCW5788888.1 hypothetical protein [Polyangiaceae bacterium]